MSFKRLYIITFVELIVLLIFLLWKPSEAASQFLFGRSVYRWILALPAIFLIAIGLIFLIVYLKKRRLPVNLAGSRKIMLDSLKGSVGPFLLTLNASFLFFFSLWGWLSYKYRLSEFFIHSLPWCIFLALVIWQYSYWMVVNASAQGEEFNLKKIISDLPSFLRKIIFDRRESFVQIDSFLEDKFYWISVSVLICVFIFVGWFFIKFAGLNSDEGWYLYAARQVYLGQRPYQDFAFTQMPLLPYIYGIGLSIIPSVYTGRVTSFIISCLSLYIIFQLTKKYFNREAFIWLLFILVVNSDSFYFNTIVKTYSLTFLFFVLSLYFWISPFKAKVKYPLLFLILLLGIFTRLTFAFYAFYMIVKAVWEIWKLKNRSIVFTSILVLNTPILLGGLTFLYPDPHVAVWDIYTYNAGIHGFFLSTSAMYEYISHFAGYLRSVKVFWPIGIPMVLALISGGYYRSLKQAKLQPLFEGALAVFIFLSVHFWGNGPMYEYYIPATGFLLMIIIWFLFSFAEIKSGINLFVLWTTRLVLTLITIISIYKGRFGFYNYEYYHGHPPIETLRNIAGVVDKYYPGQPIFTMEALYVAIESGREIYPGMSMAQFSILDIPAEEAKRLHFINYEMLIDILESKDTKILILNEREVASLGDIVENNYTSVFEIDDFGQKSIKAFVFIRNE